MGCAGWAIGVRLGIPVMGLVPSKIQDGNSWGDWRVNAGKVSSVELDNIHYFLLKFITLASGMVV